MLHVLNKLVFLFLLVIPLDAIKSCKPDQFITEKLACSPHNHNPGTTQTCPPLQESQCLAKALILSGCLLNSTFFKEKTKGLNTTNECPSPPCNVTLFLKGRQTLEEVLLMTDDNEGCDSVKEHLRGLRRLLQVTSCSKDSTLRDMESARTFKVILNLPGVRSCMADLFEVSEEPKICNLRLTVPKIISCSAALPVEFLNTSQACFEAAKYWDCIEAVMKDSQCEYSRSAFAISSLTFPDHQMCGKANRRLSDCASNHRMLQQTYTCIELALSSSKEHISCSDVTAIRKCHQELTEVCAKEGNQLVSQVAEAVDHAKNLQCHLPDVTFDLASRKNKDLAFHFIYCASAFSFAYEGWLSPKVLTPQRPELCCHTRGFINCLKEQSKDMRAYFAIPHFGDYLAHIRYKSNCTLPPAVQKCVPLKERCPKVTDIFEEYNACFTKHQMSGVLQTASNFCETTKGFNECIINATVQSNCEGAHFQNTRIAKNFTILVTHTLSVVKDFCAPKPLELARAHSPCDEMAAYNAAVMCTFHYLNSDRHCSRLSTLDECVGKAIGAAACVNHQLAAKLTDLAHKLSQQDRKFC